MLVASSEIQEGNLAWLTEKPQGPFFCPACNTEVILKKGKIRAHHFAHKPPVDCIYGVGESQIHLKVKCQVYEALATHPDCSKCELERQLNGVRPDISLYIRGTRVAIEVQKSTIDTDEIYRRTQRYTDLDIYLLWILPDNSPSTSFRPREGTHVHWIREWEKYLHAMYWGCLYYWQSEAIVLPCHFDSFSAWVEESQWYSEDGEEMSAGGYYRKTKSLKVPNMYNKLHIADDFRPTIHEQWSNQNWTIPNAKLWINTSQN